MDASFVQPPRIRFALMVDHFDQTAGGKLILIGVFDNLYVARRNEEQKPLPFGSGFLVVQMEASLAYGEKHQVAIRCVNADGVTAFEIPAQEVEFSPAGEGMPLRATMAVQIGAISFPEYGHYEWCVRVDDIDIGSCQFAVWERK